MFLKGDVGGFLSMYFSRLSHYSFCDLYGFPLKAVFSLRPGSTVHCAYGFSPRPNRGQNRSYKSGQEPRKNLIEHLGDLLGPFKRANRRIAGVKTSENI